MKRIGFEIRIKPEMADEYKEWHTKVWPELLDALRKHGWRNVRGGDYTYSQDDAETVRWWLPEEFRACD